MASKKKLEIALVPFPLQGHLTPMLQLGAILHSKGFSITVAHSKHKAPNPSNHPDFIFWAPNPSNHPDFIFLALADILPESNSGDFVGFTEHLNEKCKPHFQDYLVETTERSHQQDKPDDEGHQIACIIHDPFMYFAADIAQMLKLPSIILYSSNASSIITFTYLRRLHAQGLLVMKEDSTLDDSVPELQPLRFKDLPIFMNGNLFLDVTLQLVALVFRRPHAVIWNTTDHLEHSALEQLQQHQNYHQVPFFAIGPFHKIGQTCSTSLLTEYRSYMSWLDKQEPNSVIYISLGSLAIMDDKGFTEMAWGLAQSNQPFLWVVRPGSVLGSEWTELLPEKFKETVGERGCIVKWVPQKEVLAHEAVGGFWSHCGWNSTLESICEGVPMLCWPSSTDQPVNARYLSYVWGVFWSHWSHCGWNSTLESICEGVPMLCWPSSTDQPVNARYLSYVWGVGMEMERELERGEIERAIKRLMVEEEGLEIRKRAAELKDKVEAAMKEGGTSWNSLNDLMEYILSFQHLVAAKPEIEVYI